MARSAYLALLLGLVLDYGLHTGSREEGSVGVCGWARGRREGLVWGLSVN